MKDSLTVSRSGENLSVNASHCHLPYRGEALAFRKVLSSYYTCINSPSSSEYIPLYVTRRGAKRFSMALA